MSEAGAYLAGIRIYPIKSLDPVALTEAAILPSGALTHDREFALRDSEGRYVNAKRHAQIHQLRMAWEPERNAVCLRPEGANRSFSFSLTEDRAALEDWLSRFFDQPIMLARNLDSGFPDDLAAPGPTVISTATLEEVASWYSGLSVGETRTRFRANLEIGGVPAFWKTACTARSARPSLSKSARYGSKVSTPASVASFRPVTPKPRNSGRTSR